PSRAVRRRAVIIVVIAVLGPLPCIALHVVEAEGVRRKAPDWRRMSIAIIAGRNRPITGTRYRALRRLICAVAVAAQIFLVIAERIARIGARLGSSARRIFPLRFG